MLTFNPQVTSPSEGCQRFKAPPVQELPPRARRQLSPNYYTAAHALLHCRDRTLGDIMAKLDGFIQRGLTDGTFRGAAPR